MKISELVGILQMLFNRYKFLVVLFLFGFSFSLNAQNKIMSLEDCITLAVKNNPQLKVSEANFESGEANVTLSRSGLMPQISLTSTASRSGGTFITGPISRVAN